MSNAIPNGPGNNLAWLASKSHIWNEVRPVEVLRTTGQAKVVVHDDMRNLGNWNSQGPRAGQSCSWGWSQRWGTNTSSTKTREIIGSPAKGTHHSDAS